jgi:hypothetical protein
MLFIEHIDQGDKYEKTITYDINTWFIYWL